ncbi:DUF1836 domain-containing protein [Amphibacillus sp. Q70]|uniref:DUF1836 domain-containing protein n=1 Tax=Amphibacillus sp. Q70 TaxID=3453416 RepID=UPI003F8666EF
MEQLEELLALLDFKEMIEREDIPKIDLYMDQVTQLFEGTYGSGKRNEKEKILTKTMINNYAKDDLLFPIKNKKYSKEHIMFIQFIYQLKGSLSINDVRTVLEKLNRAVEEETVNLDKVYDQYVSLMTKQVEDFTAALTPLSEEADEAAKRMDHQDSSYMRQLYLIFSLVHHSNMYRKLAERLTDQLVELEQDNSEKN